MTDNDIDKLIAAGAYQSVIHGLVERVAELERRLRWDPDELPSRVAELERRLAPDVRRIRYTLGEDHGGDPAVFFRVLLSDSACRGARLFPLTKHVESEIVAYLGLDRPGVGAPLPYPYFNFRSESEQAQLKEESWE